MSDTERQARCRAARAAGRPAIRTRRPADHCSRARRWHDTVAELVVLQAEYEAWLAALPETLQDTATAEALHTIAHDLRPRPHSPPSGRAAERLRPGLSPRGFEEPSAAGSHADTINMGQATMSALPVTLRLRLRANGSADPNHRRGPFWGLTQSR